MWNIITFSCIHLVLKSTLGLYTHTHAHTRKIQFWSSYKKQKLYSLFNVYCQPQERGHYKKLASRGCTSTLHRLFTILIIAPETGLNRGRPWLISCDDEICAVFLQWWGVNSCHRTQNWTNLNWTCATFHISVHAIAFSSSSLKADQFTNEPKTNTVFSVHIVLVSLWFTENASIFCDPY